MNTPAPYRFLVCEAWSETLRDTPLVGSTPPVLSFLSGTLPMAGVLCRICRGHGHTKTWGGTGLACDQCHGQGVAAWGMVAAGFVT